MPEPLGGYGLLPTGRTILDHDAVDIAVISGQIEKLKLLLADGRCNKSPLIQRHQLILFAIQFSQLSMLRMLLKPEEQGGYGLSFEALSAKGEDPLIQMRLNAAIAPDPYRGGRIWEKY